MIRMIRVPRAIRGMRKKRSNDGLIFPLKGQLPGQKIRPVPRVTFARAGAVEFIAYFIR
jgi:hypothetical protein